ncbi:MAG: cysteine hydrolase [Acidobacteriota bacterium]|nr:cysteine hydrolase [Acidobacteriota bacterium]
MSQNESLHGNAPDNSSAALLIIDVISDFEFEDGEKLFENALPMAEKLAAFKKRAKDAGIPAIYVNDNFGKWQSDFKKLLAHASDKSVRGSKIAELLAPDADDYFVLKPKHSGFFSTTLDILLEHLKCETLILTGVATDICILFTANDAYMRDFNLVVPRDCVAANDTHESERTLEYIERLLKADTNASTEIDLEKLTKAA